MGLIKAAFGAAGGTLADTWKEFFYCEAIDNETLVVRGEKQTSGRSSNTKGNDNIISNGSGIAVADGQCMIIVDQGRVVEICAEPGEFTYDTSAEPSLFTGDLDAGISETLNTMGRRMGYGGDTGRDQRVYYFNIKEITDNKFGTANPVPFRVVDKNVNLDLDVSIRCSGVFSYKIADPVLFYTNVCGNVPSVYRKGEIKDQLKMEFISALQPAFAELSELQIRPNQIVAHTAELEEAMNRQLSEKWRELRGLEIVSIAISSLSLPEEDQQMIKDTQRAGALRDPSLAAGTIAGAQADAMKTAAGNEGGAMNGFVGMGMAMNAGGSSVKDLYSMGRQETGQDSAAHETAAAAAGQSGAWTCPVCGKTGLNGNFCSACGAKKPEGSQKKFCPNCGKELPAGGRFCPECGAPV